MKAIVCVKQVPDTSGKVSAKPDGTLDRASMATITNPDDLNAGGRPETEGRHRLRGRCCHHGPPAGRGHAA